MQQNNDGSAFTGFRFVWVSIIPVLWTDWPWKSALPEVNRNGAYYEQAR